MSLIFDRRTVLSVAATASLMLGYGSGGAAGQTTGEILLPGDEYHETELPDNAAGTWFVLHRSAGELVLEEMQVALSRYRACGDEQPGEQRHRAVSVPAAGDPIVLLRGYSDLTPGPVRTVVLDGDGERKLVEAPWGDETITVRHIAEEPRGEEAGTYRIALALGARELHLREDVWHGDGHWRVRWIGDLNRDGWPDLLLDASHKYSLHTTRLYLSSLGTDGRLVITESATVSHSAC